MNPDKPNKDAERRTTTDPGRPESEHPDRKAAPPIEREHETAAGVFEEEEQRERDPK